MIRPPQTGTYRSGRSLPARPCIRKEGRRRFWHGHWLVALAVLAHAAFSGLVLADPAAPVDPATPGNLAAPDKPAAPPAKPVRAAVSTSVEKTTAGATARVIVTVQNPSDRPLAVQVGQTFWFDRASDRPDRPARWTSLPSGDPPDADRASFTLAGKATGTFQVEGTFEQAGLYETYLQVEGSDTVAPQRFTVSITRTVRDLPADLLRDPRTALFQLGLSTADEKERRVGVIAHNGTSEPVALGTSSIGPIYRTDAVAETAVDGLAMLRRIDGHCPDTLGPGANCDLQLTLPGQLGPGKYAVDVALNGAQAGQSARTMKFEVRASPWLAAILVMIGALAGTLVTYWRDKGRALVDQLVAAAETRIHLERLTHAAPTRPLAAAAQALLDACRTLEDAITRGSDGQAALADLGKRTVALAKAASAVRSGAAAAQPIFAGLTARIDMIVGTPDWKPEDLDAACGVLRAELEAAGDLSRALDAARRLEARLQRLGPWITGTAAEARRAFRKALTDATDPVAVHRQGPAQGAGADQPELAKRADALLQLCKELETSQPMAVLEGLRAAVDERAAVTPPLPEKPKLDDLGRRIATAASAPSVEAAAALIAEAGQLKVDPPRTAPGASALTTAAEAGLAIPQILPGDTKAVIETDAALLGFRAGQSVRGLRARQDFWNVVTNVLVLLVIGAVGVLTIWLPNTAWGSTFDVIMALLAGVGTRLAIGALPGTAAR